MNKILMNYLIVFLLFLFSFIAAKADPTDIREHEAYSSILALNYCHMSLYKISEYSDRIILGHLRKPKT